LKAFSKGSRIKASVWDVSNNYEKLDYAYGGNPTVQQVESSPSYYPLWVDKISACFFIGLVMWTHTFIFVRV
jgi:hypothetical protein